MKLNYYILWVEDDTSWFDTTAELLSDTIKDYGFHPKIERKKSLDEVVEELVSNGLKKYDIFLIDFKLRNSKDGDSIIDFLRDKNIYTDIIFYSSDKQSITDSIKEHLFEGVYHSDRREIESKFEKVFHTTIKKIEEINSMRGLIVGETSDLDSMIEDGLQICITSDLISSFDTNDFIENNILKSNSDRDAALKLKYEDEGTVGVLHLMDSIKKWKLLRGILKKNTSLHAYVSEFLKLNKAYQSEVIEIRNKFAHAKVLTNDEGKEFLKAQSGKDNYEFDEAKFKQIRLDLKKHRESLEKLIEHIKK
ncbi:MAG: hypothetical protein QM731_08760 [Chitinophagaceae bacterium]